MHIYNLIAGVVLLLFGRKLFWLFLGIAGFLIGMEIAPMFFGDEPRWLQFSIAVGTGCLGAFVAILAQRLAFALGGFFAGMYLALGVGHFFALADANATLFLALGGGIIGAIIAALIMDTAITILVCLVGAGAIVGELQFSLAMQILIFLLLAGAGVIFQEKLWPAAQKK